MTAVAAAPKRIRYRRPPLYPAQEAALFNDARYGLVEASTKAGKTVGCLVWIHEQAALGGRPGRNYWWIAPIAPQARIAFDRLQRFLPPGSFSVNKTNKTITLANGAVIWFKGAHDSDSLYGEDVYAAVIDEATRVKEDSWIAIRSTLTATRGPVRIIGNVKGRKNWAYLMARRAESGEPNMHYARLTAYDAVRGGVIHPDEVADAKRVLPEAAFRELYLALPGDDGSNPFGRAAIEACTVDGLADTDPKVWGIDLARKQDWTVAIALDRDRRVCRLRRFQLPWIAQVQTLRKSVGLTPALVDSTGVGDAILAQLQVDRGNYEGFIFNGPSRQKLLEGLAYRISAGEIQFPQEVADELDEFEWVYTAGGNVKWAVPEGMHDDRVMAVGLAERHHGRGRPNVRFLDDDDE